MSAEVNTNPQTKTEALIISVFYAEKEASQAEQGGDRSKGGRCWIKPG